MADEFVASDELGTKVFSNGYYAELWPMLHGKYAILLILGGDSRSIIKSWSYESKEIAMGALARWSNPDEEPDGFLKRETMRYLKGRTW